MNTYYSKVSLISKFRYIYFKQIIINEEKPEGRGYGNIGEQHHRWYNHHRDLIQKYLVEGFYEVNFTESVWALQLMCEVAEVGEGEGVEDSLTVDVTEISPRPQASSQRT